MHTGQHFDANMSDIFFEEMEIPRPQYQLNINSLSHGAMTGRMMEKIEEILLEEKPDYLLVYGDTNSTLAGSLAAKKLHIKVVHVEAGLRSYNMEMPEEVNRILTDRISDILFCPTQTAVDNLKKEGYENIQAEIHLSGDVMEDAALYYAKAAGERSDILASLNLKPGNYILCTLHRAENTDNPERLGAIIRGLNRLALKKKVVMPIHPRTRAYVQKHGLELDVELIDPVGYFDMIQLLTHTSLVITDSGGLQKEAYFFHKYCVTARDQTEWVELVDHGFNQLVGADENALVEAAEKFMSLDFVRNVELYGGGKAADAIAGILKAKGK